MMIGIFDAFYIICTVVNVLIIIVFFIIYMYCSVIRPVTGSSGHVGFGINTIQ